MEGIHIDERDTNITAAIIHLAHTLELNIIAEGVEKGANTVFERKECEACTRLLL